MKYKVNLNGKIYEVEVEEGEAMLLAEYNAKSPSPAAVQTMESSGEEKESSSAAPVQQAQSSGTGTQIKAPLPGNIMKLEVSTGQRVKAGQVLLVIEAMKMENEVLAPRDGTIKAVMVSQGQMVQTGHLLMLM